MSETLKRWRSALNRAKELFSGAGNTASRDVDDGFLPNFCSGDVLLNVFIIAEMLAVIITLITLPYRLFASPLLDLIYISLFIQWIAFANAAALCLARKRLNLLSHIHAIVMAFLLSLCTTALISEAALWILHLGGHIHSPRPVWYTYFHIQNLCISAIANGLALRYFFAKHELKQRTLSESKAKMQALRSRIRPHFVFNTMNIIASLVRSDPIKAEEAIEDMCEIFRMMLNEHENLVPVRSEIEVARKYVALEQLRFGDRLQVEWKIDKFQRKAIMPVLTLQLIIENAIQQNIEPSMKGGAISIRMMEEEEKISIIVGGTAPEAVRKNKIAPLDTAMADMQKRLESHYGRASRFEQSKDDKGFITKLIIPIRGEQA